jgi:Protein of unknown function (DUF3306)
MFSDDQGFLRRWSRLKRQPAAKPEIPAAPPELPPLESLSFESDFGAFMHAKVDAHVRRAALKTLFRDPRFNVMDGLDVYIDDYSKEDPIPQAMLAQLEHARTTLFGPQTEEEAKPEEDAGTPPQAASSNEPPPDH